MATKKKDAITDPQSFTCPNSSCGRVFSTPLKAKDLRSRAHEIYNACPYCLTEITVEKTPALVRDDKKPEVEETEVEKSAVRSLEKEQGRSDLKTSICTQYFGYLSKRSSKEKIPEGCMTCEKIVQCMLKNVTG